MRRNDRDTYALSTGREIIATHGIIGIARIYGESGEETFESFEITEGFGGHLDEIGESYTEHLLFTLRIGSLMFVAGAAIIVHGLMPFIFETTGSDLIAHINKLLSERRARLKNPE